MPRVKTGLYWSRHTPWHPDRWKKSIFWFKGWKYYYSQNEFYITVRILEISQKCFPRPGITLVHTKVTKDITISERRSRSKKVLHIFNVNNLLLENNSNSSISPTLRDFQALSVYRSPRSFINCWSRKKQNIHYVNVHLSIGFDLFISLNRCPLCSHWPAMST